MDHNEVRRLFTRQRSYLVLVRHVFRDLNNGYNRPAHRVVTRHRTALSTLTLLRNIIPDDQQYVGRRRRPAVVKQQFQPFAGAIPFLSMVHGGVPSQDSDLAWKIILVTSPWLNVDINIWEQERLPQKAFEFCSFTVLLTVALIILAHENARANAGKVYWRTHKGTAIVFICWHF